MTTAFVSPNLPEIGSLVVIVGRVRGHDNDAKGERVIVEPVDANGNSISGSMIWFDGAETTTFFKLMQAINGGKK